jgi:hypothetical protein
MLEAWKNVINNIQVRFSYNLAIKSTMASSEIGNTKH